MKDPEREVRFATVIYGGVSLAIYINGIAQEMLHLVRSTAADRTTGSPIPKKDLTPVEKVYRTLSTMVGEPARETPKRIPGKPPRHDPRPGTAGLCAHVVNEMRRGADGETIAEKVRREQDDFEQEPILTRFVVDILSGTSAGGINAIFLAKALAGNLSLESLARMWINDADLDLLLNDKEIKPKGLRQSPPPALLNARWMYRELLLALQDMKGPVAGEPSDLVDDMDLYCTTTDLLGLPVDIPLTDESVSERRYRNFYHFKRRIEMKNDARTVADDFAAMDPFLAFAARCTSSFPLAFEPMELQDIYEIIQAEPRFRDYLSNTADENGVPLFGPDVARIQGAAGFARICDIYRDSSTRTKVPFSYRPFGDGGYLDNKPFTYAIETIKKRHAMLRVDRKLVYIEPSPESSEAARASGQEGSEGKPPRPNAVENSLDALIVLPRYETIRQDIESVIEWNADIARLHRVLDHFEEVVEARSHDELRNVESTLGYDSYWRLRLSSAADQLADRIVASLGVASTSADGQAVRSIVGAWREKHFGAVSATENPKAREWQQRFLDLFDFDFCAREIRFLRRRLQHGEHKTESHDLLKELDRIALDFMALANQQQQIALDGHVLECWDQFLKFIVDPREAARAMGIFLPDEAAQTGSQMPMPDANLYPDFLSATDAGRDSRVRWLLESDASVGVLSLKKPDPKETKNDLVKETKNDLVKFSEIVETVAKSVVEAYAAEGVTYNTNPAEDPLKPLDGLTRLQQLGGRMGPLFNQVKVPDPPEPGQEPISGWQFFHVQDVQMFPLIFGTTLGEFESVEIFRISPQDTRPIAGTAVDPKADPNANPPLCGDKLWAFGGFLDRRWRLNDMLRGRLDGAERLITAILPDSDPETVHVREHLIGAALEAIAEEWVEFQKQLPPPQRPGAAAQAKSPEVSR